MKTNLFGILLGLVFVTQTGLARAADADSGNSYLSKCKEAVKAIDIGEANYQDASACAGFILGATDILRLWNDSGELNVCIPKEVTEMQMTRVYLKYMEEHPQNLHMRASMLLVQAVAEAFPCD